MIGISSKITDLAIRKEREMLVCVVRERFGGSDAYKPRLDVRSLCQKIGIPITTTSFDGMAALAVRDRHGRIEVAAALSPDLPRDEERFMLAHLLGHFFLHVQPKLAAGEWNSEGYKEQVSAQHRYVNQLSVHAAKIEERERDHEADDFAAALLLPVGPLKRALLKLQDPDHVAAFFGVTPQVLARRLEDLSGQESAPKSFTEAEDRLDRDQRVKGRIIKKSDDPTLESELAAPKNPDVDLSKIQRVMAKAGYKKDQDTEDKKKASARKKSRPGLERLRALARKIDSSVD